MSSSAQDWAAKAQAFQQAGKYAEAAEAYNKVLEFAPNIAEVHLNKGVVLSAAGRDSEALQCFDRAIELKPDLSSAHCNRANIMKASGRPKEAAKSYREAVKLDPKMQNAWFGLAHVLNEQDLYSEALEAADKSIELAGSKIHAPSHNERVFALLKLSRGAEAIKDIDVLTAQTPMEQLDARARKLYSLVLSQAAIERTGKGNHAEALVFHERAAAAEPSFQNLFNQAISLIQNEKQDDALKILAKAKASDSGNWKVHAAIGTIHMQKQNYELAAEAFTAAAKFPETKDDETVNFNLGVALMNLGKEKEAREPLERATKANRENWTAQALLGTIYIGQENFKMAENVLQVASSLPQGSSDASVWYNLGYSQLQNNNGTAALTSFKKSLEIDPSSSQAKAAIEALTATPEEIKTSMQSGAIAQMEKEFAAEDAANNAAPTLAEVEQVMNNPNERAKVLIKPQRPPFLRRKSMEGIVMGRVFELKETFEKMAVKPEDPSIAIKKAAAANASGKKG
jgi:tetratricopeptide (TPR) repeat protein